MNTDYALGVDLGTTYTCAAVYSAGRLEVVQLGDHSHAIPTVAYLRDDGVILVGDAARRRAETDPLNVVSEFKRDLGSDAPHFLGDRPVTAVELLAHVLRYVVDTVTTQRGDSPSRLTLTCPASWHDERQGLLREVANAAGWPKIVIVDEPTAAATHYASLPNQRVPPGTLFGVYDLGGGTFDVAVVRKTRDGFESCGHPGGADLGGMDFDEIVFAHVQRLLAAEWPSARSDPTTLVTLARLRADATDRKEALSHDTEVSVPVVLANRTAEVRLTREEFEESAAPLVAETVEVFREVVHAAGVDPSALDRVLLVGGSSRMPLVTRMFAAELPGLQVYADENPKWAVCLGAAIVAGAQLPDGVTARGAELPALDPNRLLSDFAPPGEPPEPVSAARADGATPTVITAEAVSLIRPIDNVDDPPAAYEVDLAGAGLLGLASVATHSAFDRGPVRDGALRQEAMVVETMGDDDARYRQQRSAVLLVGVLVVVVVIVAVATIVLR